jgi:PadR family transcriptional regulator, regulatory protein PadR
MRPALHHGEGVLLTFDNKQFMVLSSSDSLLPYWIAMPPIDRSPDAPAGDVLRGTLDLLILKTLSLEAMHGWAIAQRLEQLSSEALRVGQGSLYPALQRMEEKGWVESEWRATEQNRRAKYYELTPAGRRALGAEAENWRRYVEMVDLILRTT